MVRLRLKGILVLNITIQLFCKLKYEFVGKFCIVSLNEVSTPRLPISTGNVNTHSCKLVPSSGTERQSPPLAWRKVIPIRETPSPSSGDLPVEIKQTPSEIKYTSLQRRIYRHLYQIYGYYQCLCD